MNERLKVVAIAIVATFVLWLPFFLKISSLPGWNLNFAEGTKIVWSNFDGPNYIEVAKTWYDKEIIRSTFSTPLPLEYYPAHLPFYPLTINIFSVFFNTPTAMLVSNLVGTILACLMFYQLLTKLGLKSKVLMVALTLFLPARVLVIHGIGSPESWFVFFILAAIYTFRLRRFWLTGLLLALAQLTKSPGILLFGALALVALFESVQKKSFKHLLQFTPLLLGPIAIVGLFYFYQQQTGDFFAYFHSGDNFHLFFPPFSIFSPMGAVWTGDFWLEEIIWLWLVYGFGVAMLWQDKRYPEFAFALIFYISTLFVAHRDVSRYLIPIAPLVILGYQRFLVKFKFKPVYLLALIPIYLYAWQFMLHNTAPVADWTPYL